MYKVPRKLGRVWTVGIPRVLVVPTSFLAIPGKAQMGIRGCVQSGQEWMGRGFTVLTHFRRSVTQRGLEEIHSTPESRHLIVAS